VGACSAKAVRLASVRCRWLDGKWLSLEHLLQDSVSDVIRLFDAHFTAFKPAWDCLCLIDLAVMNVAIMWSRAAQNCAMTLWPGCVIDRHRYICDPGFTVGRILLYSRAQDSISFCNVPEFPVVPLHSQQVQQWRSVHAKTFRMISIGTTVPPTDGKFCGLSIGDRLQNWVSLSFGRPSLPTSIK